MSKKHLLTSFVSTVAILLTSLTLQAQIADIGSGPFTKCFIEHTPKGAILKVKLQLYEGDEVLYFDNENNIRKYVSDFNYPESRFLVVTSYDISGKLSSIIFSISVPEGISCYGAAAVSYNNSNEPLFDYEVYTSKDYGEWQVATNFSNIFPDVDEELDVYNYIDINALQKTLDLKEINIPSGCQMVNFRRPQKYDMAMLNAYEPGWKVSIIDNVETNEKGEKRYKVEYKGKHEYFPDSAFEDIEITAKN